MLTRLTHLTLTRPLVVLDVETTGRDVRGDRVVEFAAVRFAPEADPVELHLVLDPGIPIPAQAMAVHGLSDEDVEGCPTFEEVAGVIGGILADADLAGFNVGFDLRFVIRELTAAGGRLPDGVVLDAMRIFHRREPRDLAAAMRFYLGEEHEAAHSALADGWAAIRVLDAQLGRYAELPRSVAELAGHFSEVDLEGRLTRVEGKLALAFGKHRGRRLCDVARDDAGYLRWMLDQDFLPDVTTWVRRALDWAEGSTAGGAEPGEIHDDRS